MTQVQQGRPVTLVGYSLGARVIAYALLTLSKNKAYGLVDSVYLAGAPVVFTADEWAQCAEVVENRFVNGYSSVDWVLGKFLKLYLHRCVSHVLLRVLVSNQLHLPVGHCWNVSSQITFPY
jgi:pimeloyl-ACP methyl ester carboxylesterase